jgi:hypothetical protein
MVKMGKLNASIRKQWERKIATVMCFSMMTKPSSKRNNDTDDDEEDDNRIFIYDDNDEVENNDDDYEIPVRWILELPAIASPNYGQHNNNDSFARKVRCTCQTG